MIQSLIKGCIHQSTDTASHTQHQSGPNQQTSIQIDAPQTTTTTTTTGVALTTGGTTNSGSNSISTNNPGSIVAELKRQTGGRAHTARTHHRAQQQQQQQQQHHDTDHIQHAVSLSSRDVRRRPSTNETVFRVNKGVKVFDFSFEKNLLVTGG